MHLSTTLPNIWACGKCKHLQIVVQLTTQLSFLSFHSRELKKEENFFHDQEGHFYERQPIQVNMYCNRDVCGVAARYIVLRQTFLSEKRHCNEMSFLYYRHDCMYILGIFNLKERRPQSSQGKHCVGETRGWDAGVV